MVEVRRSNPKAYQTLTTRLEELAGKDLKVGWFESAKYENGTPVAYAAAINELGSPKNSIPARPFMRPTLAGNRQRYIELAKQGARAVLAGTQTIDQVLGKLGFLIQEDIKVTINGVISPPLSPITIMARKYRKEGKPVTGKTIGEIAGLIKAGKADLSGVSTKPLIDTHLLIDTLTNVVENSK